MSCKSDRTVNEQLNRVTPVEILNWSVSECDRDADPYYKKPRLINEVIVKEGMNLSVNFAHNCCFEPTPQAFVVKDTLKLFSNDGSPYDGCNCMCCFTLDYELTGITRIPAYVQFDGDFVSFELVE